VAVGAVQAIIPRDRHPVPPHRAGHYVVYPQYGALLNVLGLSCHTAIGKAASLLGTAYLERSDTGARVAQFAEAA